MSYVLYNKESDVYLTHPAIGIWKTTDKSEAEEMLRVCKEYVVTLGLNPDDFLIKEIN